MVTWTFWLGIVLVTAGALPASFAWYGKILGILEKEKAKKIWISGVSLIPLGLILIFSSIGKLPELSPEMEKELVKPWFPFLWLAIGILIIASIPFGIVTQAKVLEMIKLKTETVQKIFKISFIIFSIGMIFLLWVLMPGHILPLPSEKEFPAQLPPKKEAPLQPKEDFCGWSNYGACKNDADCNAGGCSGEVCERKGEQTATICIWKDCYDAKAYGLECKCVNNQCQWY